eukprot:scaffold360_cov334-Prasinococcus_capsulatus_cf.AAC.1
MTLARTRARRRRRARGRHHHRSSASTTSPTASPSRCRRSSSEGRPAARGPTCRRGRPSERPSEQRRGRTSRSWSTRTSGCRGRRRVATSRAALRTRGALLMLLMLLLLPAAHDARPSRPALGRYCLHPCGTAELMAVLCPAPAPATTEAYTRCAERRRAHGEEGCNRRTWSAPDAGVGRCVPPPRRYLLGWLSVAGAEVGLHLPGCVCERVLRELR